MDWMIYGFKTSFSQILFHLYSNVDYQVVGIFLALGIGGSLAGTALSQRIPQVALRHAFGWFVLVMAGIIAATNV